MVMMMKQPESIFRNPAVYLETKPSIIDKLLSGIKNMIVKFLFFIKNSKFLHGIFGLMISFLLIYFSSNLYDANYGILAIFIGFTAFLFMLLSFGLIAVSDYLNNAFSSKE